MILPPLVFPGERQKSQYHSYLLCSVKYFTAVILYRHQLESLSLTVTATLA